MNRRKFFSAALGFSSGFGVVAALRSCYTPRIQFPPEEILEIDEEGIVHPLDVRWEPGTMLSYDPKTRTILRVREPFKPL